MYLTCHSLLKAGQRLNFPRKIVAEMLGSDEVGQLSNPCHNFSINNITLYTPCPDKKRCHHIFDYNCRISWSIFILCAPMETGMNTTEQYVIYLLKRLMTS